jgi:type II secretory pathway pseudopilin PulG
MLAAGQYPQMVNSAMYGDTLDSALVRELQRFSLASSTSPAPAMSANAPMDDGGFIVSQTPTMNRRQQQREEEKQHLQLQLQLHLAQQQQQQQQQQQHHEFLQVRPRPNAFRTPSSSRDDFALAQTQAQTHPQLRPTILYDSGFDPISEFDANNGVDAGGDSGLYTVPRADSCVTSGRNLNEQFRLLRSRVIRVSGCLPFSS